MADEREKISADASTETLPVAIALLLMALAGVALVLFVDGSAGKAGQPAHSSHLASSGSHSAPTPRR